MLCRTLSYSDICSKTTRPTQSEIFNRTVMVIALQKYTVPRWKGSPTSSLWRSAERLTI